jgi:hypothetical protein
VEGQVHGPRQTYLPAMRRSLFFVPVLCAVVASTALFLALSHSIGERKARTDRLRIARCKPISVPYEVTTRPEFIRAVQNCIDRAGERRESRWGPWNAWGGDDED